MRRKKKIPPTNLQVWVEIERRESSQSQPYLQKISYETTQMNATVATLLGDLAGGDYIDDQGKPVTPVTWQCSCLQKKCGACAMVVNGVPKLACDCFLRDHPKGITLTPLSKFPVVVDLMVDRSILFENLKTMELWVEEAHIPDKHQGQVFAASKCLQCGCCLEVCPNFGADDAFLGAASFVPTAGVLTALSSQERQQLLERYKTHGYAGCGKSLACHAVCPAGIDIEHLLLHTNHIAFWKNKGDHH